MVLIVFANKCNPFFKENSWFSDIQHAYQVGHSTKTALTQITKDCLVQIDNDSLVEALLLDFSAAFYVRHHELLNN